MNVFQIFVEFRVLGINIIGDILDKNKKKSLKKDFLVLLLLCQFGYNL